MKKLLRRALVAIGALLIAIVLITLQTWFIGRAVFNIELATMPLWAG